MALVKVLSDTKYTIKDIHDFIKTVYEKRADEGIHFQALSKSTESIEQRIDDNHGIVFVAVDEQSQELLGTGTILFHYDEERGCHYIISSTASNAVSSIKYQLKSGAKKYGFSSAKNSDYYSIYFRKDIVSSFKGSALYCFIRYQVTKAKTKLLFHKDGSFTKLGEVCYNTFKQLKR